MKKLLSHDYEQSLRSAGRHVLTSRPRQPLEKPVL